MSSNSFSLLGKFRLGRSGGVFLLLGAAILPLLFELGSQASYLQYTAVRMMILGLYAMSFDLLFGFTGIFSFGHAAAFGASAYASAILFTRFQVTDPILVILGGLILAVIVSVFIGFLSSRVGSVAVFLVTFASTEVMQLIAFSNPAGLTNGENGIAGVKRTAILGLISIKPELNFYYFTLLILALSYLILRKTVHSPLGDVFQGIRGNTERVRFLGYNVEQYKVVSFAISGLFAGVAGSLNALLEGTVAPEVLSWFLSGDAVLFTVLGGPGTLIGPIFGAVIIVLVQEILSDFLREWLVFVGISYVALILFLPKGVFPMFLKIFRNGKKEIPNPSAILKR
jgi:branched-chain amino acid transport system permease protein